MSTLYDEIQEVKAQYPVARSAVLPALRLAQERYGWLSPEAFSTGRSRPPASASASRVGSSNARSRSVQNR